MHGGAEPGGRVLVVAEGGHEPLVRALTAEGHSVGARLPAEALGPEPEVIVVVRADPAASASASSTSSSPARRATATRWRSSRRDWTGSAGSPTRTAARPPTP